MSDYKWTMWQFENVYHDTHLGYEGHYVRPHTTPAVQDKIAQINTGNVEGSEQILAKHDEALERVANVCITESFFVNEDTGSPYRQQKSRATDFRKFDGDDEFTPVVKAIMMTCAADAKKENRMHAPPQTDIDDVDREMKLLMKKRVDVHNQDRGKKFLRTYDRSHKVDTKTLLHQHFTSRPKSASTFRRSPAAVPSAPTTPRRSRPLTTRGRHIKHQPTDTDSDSDTSITNKVDEFMHAIEQKQQHKAMTLLKDKFKTRRRKALLGPSAETAEDNADIILGKEYNLHKKIDLAAQAPPPPAAQAPRPQDKGFSAATMFIQRVLTNRATATTTSSSVTAAVIDTVQQTRTSASPVTTVDCVNPQTSPSSVSPPTLPLLATGKVTEDPHLSPPPESTSEEDASREDSATEESPAEWLARRMEQVKTSMLETSADNAMDDMMNIRVLSVEISLLFKGFQVLDEHKDGFLSYSDLRQYCLKYHVPLTKSVIENIMWLMDDARRGYITFEEIKNFFLQFRQEFHESGVEFASAKPPALDICEEKLPSMKESNIHAHPLLLFRLLFFAAMQNIDGCVHLLSAYQMLVQLFGVNAERLFNCIFLKYFHNITDSDRITVRNYVLHIIEHQNLNVHLKLKRTKQIGQSFAKMPLRRSNKTMRKIVVNERRKALVPYSSFSSDG